MILKVIKKIVSFIVILIILSFFVFLLLYLAPGDPAEKRLTAQGVAVTREMLDAERERMGLVRPFLVRYGEWLLSMVKGDFGVSFKDDMPVAPKLLKGLKNTCALALTSLLLSLVISFPLALLSAIRKNGIADHQVSRFCGPGCRSVKHLSFPEETVIINKVSIS